MNTIQDKKITLGQCFNLAHAELLTEGKIPSLNKDEFTTRTKLLYKIKSDLMQQLEKNHNV